MSGVTLREGSLPQNLAQTISCPVLITRRLVLRLPHVEDIETLAQLADNPHIAAQFDKLPSPFTRADAEDFVRCAESGQIGYYVYAVTRADTGAFIGCCGIGGYKTGAWPDTRPQAQLLMQKQAQAVLARSAHSAAAGKNLAETEIFFWLGAPYWGQGYGAEVANALVDAAFRATELAALYARARADNAAAGKILRKCGFSPLHISGHVAKGAETAQAAEHYCLSRDSWLELRRLSA